MNPLPLILASVAAGILILAVFRRFSDQAAVRAAKAKVKAHLYELRLFGDEPALMLRANRNLLAANARYVAAMLKPAAVLALPLALLMWQLDRAYGTRPFEPGETAVAAMRGLHDSLRAPAAFVVETPAVRVEEQNTTYWRIRARQRARFNSPGVEVEHPSATVVLAGVRLHWLAWFLILSTAAALALKRRFRVTF